MTKTMLVSEVVLDFSLYPRRQIDSHHVGEMVEAEKAGVKLPPIVIDKKSKRAIDGFHRVRVKERIYGPEATTEAIEKTYRSEKEMFLDAVRYNANHGRALSSFDKAHAIITAEKLGIDETSIAEVLSVTVDRVGNLKQKRATLRSGNLSVSTPIKRTIRHMAGKRLNRIQAETNVKLGGMEQRFYVNQLLMLIESDLIDKGNGELMEDLGRLHDALGGLLAVV